MGKIKPARSTPAQKRNSVIRWIFYWMLILIATGIMAAGDGIKPMLLIPIALCIASTVKEGAAIFMGIVCGFLIDLSCDKLLGFHAIFFMLVCMIASQLYTHLLQKRLLNMLLFTTIVCLLQSALDFFFYYAIWNYENILQILYYNKLPSFLYTLIATCVLYGIFHFVHERLMPNSNHTIEQAFHTIEPY